MAKRLADYEKSTKSAVELARQRFSREKPFQAFDNSINEEATRDFYTFGLCRFMSFIKATSTHDMLKGDLPLIEARIIDYIVHNKQLVGPGTIRGYLAGPKHFYIMNDKVLNWKKITKYIGKGYKKHEDRAYTAEEIKLLVDAAEPRGKAILLLLASTGMRVGALPLIKRKHLLEVEESGFKFYRITVYPGSREQYVTFCTPECRQAIEAYFDFRKRSGEPFDPEAPVIREQFDANDTLKAAHPIMVKSKAIQSLIKKMLIRSGLRKGEQPLIANVSRRGTIRHEVHQLHGFRKYFNTALVNAGIKPVYVELFQGRTPGIQAHYMRETESDLIKEYAKVIDLLTIDPTKRLQRQIETLTVQKTQYEEMKERMDRLEKNWIGTASALLNRMTTEEMDTTGQVQPLTLEEKKEILAYLLEQRSKGTKYTPQIEVILSNPDEWLHSEAGIKWDLDKIVEASKKPKS
jgi:integrase